MNLNLVLDKKSQTPLYQQIYKQLRERILSGEISVGSPLPSSRKLAEKQSVARITVSKAYKQLRLEGFVVSQVGIGTMVVLDLPISEKINAAQRKPFMPTLSHWGQRIVNSSPSKISEKWKQRPEIDFSFGRSFPHIFPYDIWRRLLARYLSTDDVMLSRYGSVAGYSPLREVVADYLSRLRGVKCNADQVIIISGIQQALDILCRLVLNNGDEVLVETPGYADAFKLFEMFGAKITALPVDDEGFPVELISPDCRARFAFVTPSNQFPQGGAMPLARRIALLKWAHEANALIFEDDYDGELRYSGQPLAALQGLDEDGRVVYLGTFSKVLFPALRLGYVVLPNPFVKPFLLAKKLIDRAAPTLMQAAVADFIAEGHFERHLRRLRKEYGRRRQILVQALDTFLQGQLSFTDADAGLHIMLYLESGIDETIVIKKAQSVGVGIYPGAPYHIHKPVQPSIILGFSGLSRSEIIVGVERIANVLANY